jgi:hypothetical protein
VVNTYEDRIYDMTNNLYKNFNTTLLEMKPGVNDNVYTQLDAAQVCNIGIITSPQNIVAIVVR